MGTVVHNGTVKASCMQVTYSPISSAECVPLVREFIQGFASELSAEVPVTETKDNEGYAMRFTARQYIQMLVNQKLD